VSLAKRGSKRYNLLVHFADFGTFCGVPEPCVLEASLIRCGSLLKVTYVYPQPELLGVSPGFKLIAYVVLGGLKVKTCATRYLMDEKVASHSSFHSFTMVCMVNTAEGATKIAFIDADERQISWALVKRRAVSR